jgi:hypothetical protein
MDLEGWFSNRSNENQSGQNSSLECSHVRQ